MHYDTLPVDSDKGMAQKHKLIRPAYQLYHSELKRISKHTISNKNSVWSTSGILGRKSLALRGTSWSLDCELLTWAQVQCPYNARTSCVLLYNSNINSLPNVKTMLVKLTQKLKIITLGKKGDKKKEDNFYNIIHWR